METKLFDLLLGIVANRDMYVDGNKVLFPEYPIDCMKDYDVADLGLGEWIKGIFDEAKEGKVSLSDGILNLLNRLGEMKFLYQEPFVASCTYLLEHLYGMDYKEFVGKHMSYDKATGMLSSDYGKLSVKISDSEIATIINTIEWAIEQVRNAPHNKGRLNPFTLMELAELETNYKFLKFIVPAYIFSDSKSTEESLIEEMSNVEYESIKKESFTYIDDCIKNDTHMNIDAFLSTYEKQHSKNDLYVTFLFAALKYIYGEDIPMEGLSEVSISNPANDLLVDHNKIAILETTVGHHLLGRQNYTYKLSVLETILNALEERLDESKDDSDDSNESSWDSFSKKYSE